MNVRFSDRHIRFRVTQPELARLLAGRPLTLDVPMPKAHQFRASIGVTAIGNWQLDSDPTGLWLSLPKTDLETLSQTMPSKIGLEHTFALDGHSLGVAVEVDVRKERERQAA